MALHEKRIAQARDRARAAGLSALAVMPGPNLFYLAGLQVHLSERPTLIVIPVEGDPWALAPHFEVERIAGGAGMEQVFAWTDAEGPEGAMRQAVKATGLSRGIIGVEYRQMRVLELELLAQAARSQGRSLHYVDANPLFAELRTVKDDAELAAMQRAAAICDAACQVAHESIRPGISENAVAGLIKAAVEKLGVQGSLEIMVASGPRSAIPHSGASDRVMQAGELCWLDFVCFVDGYVGDTTRTFPVGQVTGEAAKVYRICLAAQAEARSRVRAGMTGAEIDALARDYIMKAGYGEFFTHRCGHGSGLVVHEEPYIVAGNQRPPVAGNTFTIEPGIYVPGLGGVRIEDDVVLTADGARTLTTYPRDLLGD